MIRSPGSEQKVNLGVWYSKSKESTNRKHRSHSIHMKQRVSTPVITTLAVLALIFFVFQYNFSTKTRTDVTRSTSQSQDRKSLVPKSISNTETVAGAKEINCDRAHRSYDICSLDGPAVLDPTTAKFYLMTPTGSTQQQPLVEKIRPYTRKSENWTMSRIREVTIVSGPPSPKCEIQHDAPALVFSAGGYTGNFFHEFNDGFIPLYITVNSIFPDQDVVLVISKARDWWVSKYAELLGTFSKHPIVDLDNDTATHCFPSASVGMISHGFMAIDPSLIPKSKTFLHFRAFLGIAYGQNHPSVYNPPKSRPLLVLVSRSGGVGRVLLNQNEVKLEAEKIGFDVKIFHPTPGTPLKEAYDLIASSHAMVGIHGAALTHSLFLRPGSVFVQVVPLGLEWVSQVCFEGSAKAMGVEYIEYRIMAEESSLTDKYSKDEMIIKDPVAFRGNNWSDKIMNIYLKEQDVKLDLVRFRGYLKGVYLKAKIFMGKEAK